MSLQKLIEERENLYIEKVNELRQEQNWEGIVSCKDSPVHEFGYKEVHKLDGIANLFTIPDWGNIGKFHSESINLILDGVVEMVRESGLGQLIEFYESNRGSGHTYAAVKGVENSANALLLVADGHQKQSTGLPMDKQISLTGRYVLKGRRHALVVDNFALIQMFYRLISQLQTLKK